MKNRNITQSSYSQEAIETAKISKDIDDADGEAITLREKTKDLDVRRIAECAFRRGFTQGACSAINAYDSIQKLKYKSIEKYRKRKIFRLFSFGKNKR